MRPALRDVSFESPAIPEPIAQKTIAETVPHSKDMTDVERNYLALICFIFIYKFMD